MDAHVDARNGELEQVGDRWRLRFVRELPHPPEKVWRAITEARHLRAWFPDTVVGELAAGAKLRFEPGEDAGFPGFDGEVVAFDPPSLLELTWGTDRLRFELHAEGGRTRLVFTDVIDELGKAARDGAGWHACLDLLERELDGAAPSWDAGQRWAEVHPGYVERFPPEASTIGPPDGHPVTQQ